MKRATLILCLFLSAFSFSSAQAPNPYAPRSYSAGPADAGGRREMNWTLTTPADLDVGLLKPEGHRALNYPGMKWEHAQTDHFVVHFEREIFAKKVGRMAEFYYTYISGDLKGMQDRLTGRSHLFIFRTPEKWKAFLAESGAASWTFSFVQGPALFLQEADDTESSAGVLAHEMSHLILNRFFESQPPTWLNEGLAEWYGEFAYAAFKGIKKSKRSEFKVLTDPFPLPALLEATDYPEDPVQVNSFYRTSKFIVAYLRLGFPEDKFAPYLSGVTQDGEPRQMLQDHYGIATAADLEAGLAKFLR